MKLRKNRLKPLQYDLSGAVNPTNGIALEELSALLPQLSAVRDQLLSATNAAKNCEFIHLPKRLLTEYSQYRQTGTLGRIFQRANRTQALTDRVVVLGNEGVCVAPRMILEACCQPHWNELSRGDRGSKPRMYFDTKIPDNDAMQALLYLLSTHRVRATEAELDRWGLVALAPILSEGIIAPPVALASFVSALQSQPGNEPATAIDLLTAVTPTDASHATAFPLSGLTQSFCIDSLVAAPCTALSPIGLLPAAILGVNVMELLQGAAWMSDHFAQAADCENIVFQIAGVHHLLSTRRGNQTRTVNVWNAGLSSFREWYSDLVTAMLSDAGSHSMQIRASTAFNSSHQGPALSSTISRPAIHHILVESPRFDPLVVGQSNLPTLQRAELEVSDTELRALGYPTTRLTIPILDELHLGQLLQLMMLATFLESHLRSTN